MTSQPQPVLVNGTAATIAGAITPVLIAAGVQADGAPKIGAFIGAAAVAVLALLALLHARSQVTPLASPRSTAGVPLVEAPVAVASTDTAGTPAPTTPGGTP